MAEATGQSNRQIFLLGPQRPTVNLDAPFGKLDSSGPVAVISAGWQEAEDDIDDIRAIVGRELRDLRLYHRAEAVFADDRALHARYRERQDRLMALQRVHRLRLRQSLRAARELLRTDGEHEVLDHERRHAVAQLRALDRHHLKRIAAIHRDFVTTDSTSRSEALARHTGEIAREISACDTVIVTGGNVAILLNRLRLFGLDAMLPGKHIVAWSAGAMALTDRILLYHEKTPLEMRDAELLDTGLGLVSNIVLLPDARHRLRQNDNVRIKLMNLRLGKARCITLDSGTLLHFVGGDLVAAHDAHRLTKGGKLRMVRAG